MKNERNNYTQQVRIGYGEGKLGRCNYIDTITGFRCKNLSQRNQPYCRRCQSKVKHKNRQMQGSPSPQPIPINMLTLEVKALLPEVLQKECLHFLTALQNKITFNQVILYGSFTQGCAHNWSDLDLAILSSKFDGMPFIQRTILLRRIGLSSGTLNIQAMGLTPREFSQGDSPRVLRKIRQGVFIFIETEIVKWQTNRTTV